MKDSFFKDQIVSFTGEKNCEYTGSTDLYPRKNRNLINNENFSEAAIKIQRFWRNERSRKQMEQLELKKIVKKNVPERFASWFGF